MELYWISPSDVKRTEVANYSRKLMPFLCQACTVINRDDFMEGAPLDSTAGEEENDPAPAWMGQRDLGDSPLRVYHMGNSRMHCQIYDEFLQHPGLVVLHDVNLVDLAKSWADGRGDYLFWREMICRQYGEGVRELAVLSDANPEDGVRMVVEYPLFKPFLHGALGVVVHSRYAQEIVAAALPGLPIKSLDLPYPEPLPAWPRNYHTEPLVFIFCGHVGPNRRVEKFMEAWGQLPDPGRIRLQLYGNVTNASVLEACAEQHGLAGLVSINGFVEEAELDWALQRAHFALNMRWPTMGETSSSQLRYWSNALPTLVSDVGWYGELPDGVVLKVPVGNEVEALRDLLQAIVESPAEHAEAGSAGWHYLRETHAPAKYAQELVTFAGECLDSLRKQALDGDFVDTIASLCEDFSTLRLFEQPTAVAVEMFDPDTRQLHRD